MFVDLNEYDGPTWEYAAKVFADTVRRDPASALANWEPELLRMARMADELKKLLPTLPEDTMVDILVRVNRPSLNPASL